MATLEQKLVELQQENSNLVAAADALTGEVSGKIADINARVAAKESEVNQFIVDGETSILRQTFLPSMG